MADGLVRSLLDIGKSLVGNRLKFINQCERIRKDLEMLQPILDRESANSELENLRSELEKGRVLISKCAEVPFWNVVKQHIYAGQLQKLEEAIQRFWKTEPVRGVGELRSWMEKLNSELNALLEEREVGEPLHLPPSRVFGMEQPLIEVKGKLRRHQVVGVCGMGGSGKTTLVQKLCADPEIKAEYGKPIFLTVSSSTDPRTIWQKLFTKLHKLIDDGAIATASGRRSKMLIVLDDVWSVDKSIRTLVDETKNAADSRILITSRSELDDICDSTYLVNSLSKDDARKLLQHHAKLGDRERYSWKPDKQLIDEIVRGCKLHPLALEVIGGPLKKRDEREWQNTANRLKQTGGIMENVITECFSTSLTQLMEVERECFLDMGSFPEDQAIPASAIIDMWTETRDMDENGAYVILRKLGRRNLLKLVDRKCGDAGDPDGSFSSLSVTQHDLLREFAIHKSNESQITRLIMVKREGNIPETWTREKDRTSHAKLVSINTGDMKSSAWPALSLPNAEVLILNFSATSYSLPPFLQSMKNLKVLLVANHGSNRAELDGLSLLSSLNKLKRAMFRRISLPAEPLQMAEGGSGLWSRKRKFVESVISKTIGASPEPPQDLHKLSLVLCDVRHLLHIPSLFPSVRDLEIDYCIDLYELPDTICGISSLEKLSITNLPDLLRLPESIDKLSKLKVLRLHACGTLERLPQSVSQLSELRFLDISNCYSLEAFPEQIGELSSLVKIDMRSCSSITDLPSSLVQMECLTKVICNKDGASLWKSNGFAESKVDERKEEEVSLAFLHG
ncbi:putative disease resistance protein At5g47280 [Nymphaea colorata]|nr:putative disease resistance protein At5g47280 [Nymphaea colorata]